MERRISATDARTRFGELMRHVVEKQEPVVVGRSGEPHVVVISVDEYERLRAAQEEREDWRELVSEARAKARAYRADHELMALEEMLREVREKRDEQLARLR